jgi:seryl-tRNA synthetase
MAKNTTTPTMDANANANTIAEEAKMIKALGEALETLRARRKEIKAQLGKELREEDERKWADELKETSDAISRVENARLEKVRLLGQGT